MPTTDTGAPAPAAPDARASMRPAARALLGATAAGLAVAGALGAALSWDGSYYLFLVLRDQRPLAFVERVGAEPMQLPVLLASRLTDDGAVLRAVFSLSYALVPWLILWLCWRIVRREAPHLMLWPALGICLLCLPGQLFLVSESLIACELLWPLALLTVLGLPRRGSAVLGVLLAAWLVTLAAVSVLVLVALAALAAAVALRRPAVRRRMAAWASLLLVAVPLRLAVFRADVAGHSLAPRVYARQVKVAVLGAPLIAVLGVLLAGLLVAALRLGWVAEARRRTAAAGALAAVGAAGAALVVWAAVPSLWGQALDYRDVATLIALPLAALLGADALGLFLAPPPSPAREAAEPALRARLVAAAGVVFALVLTVQSVAWTRLASGVSDRLDAAGSTCVPVARATEPGTAVDHWSLGSLAIVLQGRDPRHLVLDAGACELLRSESRLQITDFQVLDARGGWLRLPEDGS